MVSLKPDIAFCWLEATFCQTEMPQVTILTHILDWWSQARNTADVFENVRSCENAFMYNLPFLTLCHLGVWVKKITTQ